MKHLVLAAFAAAAVASPAGAASIDFTASTPGYQANPLTIGNVTFSTAGTGLYVGDFGNGSGNSICATPTGATCDGILNLDFSAAVDGLSFIYAGVDSSAASISVLLSYLGGSSAAFSFTPIASNGTIDLSAQANIIGASISTSDSAGLNYDNFTFELSGAVPEPSAWALLILGFGLVGGAMRRRATGSVAIA